MASLTGSVMASRRPVRSAVAIARLSPSSVGSYSRVDRIAQPLHERGVAQGEPAGDRRLQCLDRAHHETGCADALKIEIAAEIIAAGPQWRERRLQPRFQFDETADLGRRALSHREPDALEFYLPARAFHLDHAKHEAVGALADVAGLDKAGQRHRIDRPRQHAVRNPTVFQVATAKPAATAAIMIAMGKIFRRRSKRAAMQNATAVTAATARTGS